uniref:DUF1618 domain-containing protein n=1 Tax=Oryza punctata TaxID=4537 RepID=A0A0E0MKA9_ORYPU
MASIDDDMPHPCSPDAAAAAPEKKKKKMMAGAIFDTQLIIRGSLIMTATEASHRTMTTTTTWFPFSVSLNLAAPPSLSYIHLHPMVAPNTPFVAHHTLTHGRSSLFAADAHHLLLCVIVPVMSKNSYDYPEEYFVYTADALSPALIRLPAFPDGRQRLPGDIGILTHGGGGGGFTVASLQIWMDWEVTVTVEEVAKLSLLHCSVDTDNNDWVVKKLALPPFDSGGLSQWRSEIAFSYGGKVYWADYNIGLIFCDVLESLPKLQLIKFPFPDSKFQLVFHVSTHNNCGPIKSFRTVGVSDGKIKFVDVDKCHSRPFAIVIRTWTLQMPQMVWKLDDVLDVNDLWGSASFKKYGFHQWVPEYPVVSLLDPHIVHFVLRKPMYHGQVWMITVDMRAKSVVSCKNYPYGWKAYEYMGLLFNPFFISIGLKLHDPGGGGEGVDARHHRRRPATFTRCGVIFDTDLIVRKPVGGGSHRTSTGFPFSVSLNLAAPPALSSIYLHCAEAVMPPTLEHGYGGHRGRHPPLPPCRRPRTYDHEYPEEYFVYTADALRPTLTRLPKFPDKRQRLAGDIGILSHAAATFMEWESGEGSAAILHLQEIAKLSVLQCSVDRDLDEDNTKNNDRWVVKNLAMPFDSQGDFGPRQWKSKIAFAYAGKLYWADYNIGLICCDVMESSPKLQLVKFPVPVRKIELGVSGPDDNCGQPESFRTAGVSNGKIKFDNCRSQPFAVIIRTWTLRMPEMVWELDDMLDVKELWASASFKKYVKSCKNYPNGEKGDGYKGLSFNTDFICSMLSK